MDPRKLFLSLAFDWDRWPHLASIFMERPRDNRYWTELADLVVFVAPSLASAPVCGDGQEGAPRFGMTAADVARREQLARPDLTAEQILAAGAPPVEPYDMLADLKSKMAASAATVCATWCGTRWDSHIHLGEMVHQDTPPSVTATRCFCTPACRDAGKPLNPRAATVCPTCGGEPHGFEYVEGVAVALSPCPDCAPAAPTGPMKATRGAR
jgi:hypothetical protein